MRRRLSFISADFRETTEELENPARGWYRVYSFRVEKETDFGEFVWCIQKEETSVLVVLDIGAYQKCDLDDMALASMDRILAFFDENKKDIILRITYDTKGKGMEHEPSYFSQVLTHIKQTAPLFQKYSQRIVLLEGMFVGSYGEMHNSRFLTSKYMLRLNEALMESALGIIRAVRRPVHWRMIHKEYPAAGTQVGLYNDAIFGSETDMNTFALYARENVGWEEMWAVERELEFEEQLGDFVPQCGEAVCGKGYWEFTLFSTVERLKRMHLTYLNGVYDERILDIWRNWVWEGLDVWHGINGYDYIGRHLGYRFCLRSAVVKPGRKRCKITLMIENVGFSGFYQESQVKFLLITNAGEKQEYLTDWDIREWKSGQKKSLTWEIPSSEGGKLYLSVKRKWDGEVVRFANSVADEGWIPIGELKG